MYPEHFSLLPWLHQVLPAELNQNNVSADVNKFYRIFYEYIETLLNYHAKDSECQLYRN